MPLSALRRTCRYLASCRRGRPPRSSAARRRRPRPRRRIRQSRRCPRRTGLCRPGRGGSAVTGERGAPAGAGGRREGACTGRPAPPPVGTLAGHRSPATPEADSLRQGSRAGLLRAGGLAVVARIELNAIDLAWDLIARFVDEKVCPRPSTTTGSRSPTRKRSTSLRGGRLEALGAAYGDLPATVAACGKPGVRPSTQPRPGSRSCPRKFHRASPGPGRHARDDRQAGEGGTDHAEILRLVYRDEIDKHVAADGDWFAHVCLGRN